MFTKKPVTIHDFDGPDKSRLDRMIETFNKFSLLFHALISCAICFFIEAVSRHSVFAAVKYAHFHTLAYLYNSLIIFSTLLIVYLFKRRALLRFLISGIWCFLGIVNGCLLMERVTPFGYTDLKLINDLFTMKSNYFSQLQEILAIGLVVSFLILCAVLWKKGPKYTGKSHRIVSLAVILSSWFWLPAVTNAAIGQNILSDYFTNIAKGYENYGFVYGFSTSVVGRGMKKSSEYSKEKIATIERSVNAKTTETKSVLEDGKMPNIIVVLLESFIDPSEISYVSCSENPVPNFTKLSKDFTSGYLKVPVVGAGTANTEFEILTGMNMKFFGTGEYPCKTVLQTNTCESVAGVLSKKLGYGTHVVHNNGGNFYSRANAFSKMGFDTFISKELLNITEYTPLGTWATDDILLPAVQKSLDSTPGADFVYTITVQGHGAYPTEQVIENPEITVTTTKSEEVTNQWEYYINEIHEVDKFIGNLIDDLSARDEKTLVVFFGDHLPSLDLTANDMKSGSLYKTRYATWNNFGLEKEDKNTTSYRLVADTLDSVGIHEGTMFEYQQTETDDEDYMENMELLQYDILYGKKYAYNEEDLYPASDLVMGIDEVSINSVVLTDSSAVLSGENFTPWSKVYVNDTKVNTKYVSGNCLTIARKYVDDGDTLTVKILGSGNTVFRTSNDYIVSE
jgi:phosphoglycerol transferase MdoB-like AlkP superfamily enzyme